LFDSGRDGGGRGRGGKGYDLGADPDAHVLYVGALNCARHHFGELAGLQREGRLSFLLFDEIDYVLGTYLDKIEQAAEEIAHRKNPKSITIHSCCQCYVLGTDFESIRQSLEAKLGIGISIHDGCHLKGYDTDE